MNTYKTFAFAFFAMMSMKAMEDSPEELAEKYSKEELSVQLSGKLVEAGGFIEKFLLPAIPPELHKEINCIEKALQLKKKEDTKLK